MPSPRQLGEQGCSQWPTGRPHAERGSALVELRGDSDRRAVDAIGMYPPMKHRQLDNYTPRPRHTRPGRRTSDFDPGDDQLASQAGEHHVSRPSRHAEEPVGGRGRLVRCHTTARVGLAVDGRLRRATIDDNVAMFIVVGAIVPPGDRYGSRQPICPRYGLSPAAQATFSCSLRTGTKRSRPTRDRRCLRWTIDGSDTPTRGGAISPLGACGMVSPAVD
jgi:hypothetical protein